GMTENFGYSHGVRPGQGKVGFVGTPYEGVQQRISEEGEVQVRSPGMMMGYFKEPEKTAESFKDHGWFGTRGRGEIEAEGRRRITGRTKELFKTSKGKYVAPAPIENKLGTHSDIGMVCVSGADFTQPCALVMLAEEVFAKRDDPEFRTRVTAEFEELIDSVNATLSPHEQLAFIVVVKDQWLIENSFLTPTMKIKRNKIEEEYTDMLKGWYGAKKKVIWQ
ncbi:MAG: AMP-binding protein, partial [Limnobacter sp.]|nr:AMP-binding protein [Limnobacter sp.]